jgi:phosphate transport system substrate-binding protein
MGLLGRTARPAEGDHAMAERTDGIMMPLRAGIAALLALALALSLAACGKRGTPSGGQSRQGAAALTLNGAGATFPYPLYSKWFAEYGNTNPQVRINYQSIGSGGGIKQLAAGTVDFGASDAPLSDEELKTMPAAVVQIPMVAGAVALAYNLPGVETGLKLTPDAVAGLFLGQITRWDDAKIAQANPGVKLPRIAVAVAHRSDGSGTSYIFTHYLAAVSPTWASKVGSGKSVNWPVGLGGKGNDGVASVLRQTPGAIGYVELAYAMQSKFAYAALRNPAGVFLAPSVASTTAAADAAVGAMKKDVRASIVNMPGADAYPVSGFTYILLYKAQRDPKKAQALLEFLNWAIGDGQQYAEPLVYAPLPDAVTALDRQLLATVTSGGKPVLAP